MLESDEVVLLPVVGRPLLARDELYVVTTTLPALVALVERSAAAGRWLRLVGTSDTVSRLTRKARVVDNVAVGSPAVRGVLPRLAARKRDELENVDAIHVGGHSIGFRLAALPAGWIHVAVEHVVREAVEEARVVRIAGTIGVCARDFLADETEKELGHGADLAVKHLKRVLVVERARDQLLDVVARLGVVHDLLHSSAVARHKGTVLAVHPDLALDSGGWHPATREADGAIVPGGDAASSLVLEAVVDLRGTLDRHVE